MKNANYCWLSSVKRHVYIFPILLVLTVCGCSGGTSGAFITSDSASDATVVVPPFNDTGITRCANATASNLDCPITNFPNQDADNGIDALVGRFVKIGGGRAGFDFSKLDNEGNVLAASANSWSCARDNHTDLTWEVKTDSLVPDMRDKDIAYTWYSTDGTSNGSNEGTDDGDADTIDSTQAFVVAVNVAQLCGVSDWRMPTREELRSIVDYSFVAFSEGTAIDKSYFPNTVNTVSSAYWSSLTSADSVSQALHVDFSDGSDGTSRKSDQRNVRLVRP